MFSNYHSICITVLGAAAILSGCEGQNSPRTVFDNERADKVMDLLDVDHSQSISFAEYERYLASQDANESKKILLQKFAMLDENNDALIVAGEIDAYQRTGASEIGLDFGWF